MRSTTVPDPVLDAGSVAGVSGSAGAGSEVGDAGAAMLERGAGAPVDESERDASGCAVLVPPPSHAATAATAQMMKAVWMNR
ncbi:hypothetical protein [Nocardia asteroides]|uniref:hypothetical protein n=1 Tax=Nocardia asteroides TaxID=1824 RepID=UPI001E4B8F50|nr:hypothetical protein [Nocardia asteroides]UGT61543.1 hypothetical protein LTT61_31260 [Nocardia asteroides]